MPKPRFEQWQLLMVADQYPVSFSRADKLALVERAGLKSLKQLYGLAHRMGVSRQAEYDPVRDEYIVFDYGAAA